ncbi:ANTAR domain-containing protein [Amycolatopsis sp. NPDC023774]|uniref:ANTAR domain-containing protein n=1 Tax=Amycolatopsis sp. NPDC023774 TaxID=3155015 RepID=UPI0033D6A9B2
MAATERVTGSTARSDLAECHCAAQTEQQLRQALSSRSPIEQAKGILMAHRACPADSTGSRPNAEAGFVALMAGEDKVVVGAENTMTAAKKPVGLPCAVPG